MAQLREGSIIKKSTGDEVIATVNDIPEIPTSLPADGGNADTVNGFTVNTNVPANAKFTDTNTTYSEITTAEIDAGTASTLRTITGRRVKYILDKVQGWINALTKSDVGLSNVDNVKQATKTEFNSLKDDFGDRFGASYVKNVSDSNLNDLIVTGVYRGSNLENAPLSSSSIYYYIEVISWASNQKLQRATRWNFNTVFVRQMVNDEWRDWVEIARISNIPNKFVHVGTTPPTNNNLLWINTNL